MTLTVQGKAAKVKAVAQTSSSVPVVTISGGPFTVAGATATVSAVVYPGVATFGAATQAGDRWVDPTPFTGSTTWAVTSYTLDSDEPDVGLAIAFYKSRWFTYTGTGQEVTFDITGSGGTTYLEVFDVVNASDYTTWELLQSGTAPFTTTAEYVPTGQQLILRVSVSSGTATHNATLDLDEAAPAEDVSEESGNLEVDIDPEVILETPSSVQFWLVNADPFALIDVTLVGTGLIRQIYADNSGVIQGASAPLPELAAGTYTLAFDGGGEATTKTFQVLEDPVAAPVEPGADISPTTVVGVHRWILQDPADVLADYEFTFNPSTMTDPYGGRSFTAEPTTAPDGQAQIWEGLTRAIEWSFSGYFENESDLTALENYTALNRRFFLIDHRDRYWVVTFTQFDPQPKRVIGKPYAHNYTVNAIVYGEAS